MRYDNGMLGMCISVLAIVGMILAGFALSVNQSERVVTGYEYVTDVSGLFDYSQDPQYVAYNPAANWTGFYTTDSDVTDGIDFEVSGSANNFPIKQPSTVISTTTVTGEWDTWTHAHPPGTSDQSDVTDATHYYITDDQRTSGEGNTAYINYVTVIMLSSIIEGLSLPDAWDSATIEFPAGSIIVAPQSAWTSREVQTNPGNPIPTYITAWFLPYSTYSGISSLTIDRESGLVSAYGSSGLVDTFNLSTLTVSFNAGDVYASHGVGLTNLSNSMTVTAYDAPTPIYLDTNRGVTLSTSPVNWSNGYPTGSMDVLFRVPDTGTAYTNTISVPLTSGPDGESVGTVNVYIAVASSGRVLVTISDGSNEQTVDIGQWRNFMLSMDFIGGSYSVTPVSSFATFNDYTLSGNTRTFDMITLTGTAGTVTWEYTDSSLLLGVVNTTVFMNTYGVVMTDPSLAITEYFPELADVRLNFYSFALYGSSITINGQTFTVDDSAMITIPDGGTHTLTNIYITFEDHTYITFANDGYTADLGSTTTDLISFSGNWYFTTGLYEGYETTETYYEWTVDRFIFESDGAVVVFLGLLVLGTAIGAKVVGIRTLDIVVVACAGLFGYVMLGVF